MENSAADVWPQLRGIATRILPTVPGYVLGAVLFGVLVYFASNLQPEPLKRAFNVGLCLLGGTFGWVVGVLLSPQGFLQRKQFATYGRAIAAFVSGYVLSKLDSIFTEAIKPEHIEDHFVLGFRLVAFATCFLIGALFVYIGRNVSCPKCLSQDSKP